MQSCPLCNSSTGLREILYGLPDGPVEEEKYSIGGCCISDNDPTLKCVECDWKGGNVNHLKGFSKEINAVELQDISKMSDVEIDTYAKKIWQKLAKPTKGGTDGNSKR
jgi:hypothetical protein